MPPCLRCGGHFPNKFLIDGVKRHLHNRTCCLSCLPFKSKRGGRLGRKGTPRICAVCSREYIYDRTSGHRLTICNTCSVNRFRRGAKRRCVEYKGGKCQV